ncbi:MAG: 1-deoxy-D-xylulose-5-phosphate reductoisomerase [bacterium JZ-2024 1]
MQNLVILGSTGSIGIQTLDLIGSTDLRNRYAVYGLSAYGKDIERLTQQVAEYRPKKVAIYHMRGAEELRRLFGTRVEILGGAEGIEALVKDPEVSVVVSGIAGTGALKPTYEAVVAGKTVCLANKESLVSMGPLLMEAARRSGAIILPVDSEHSAVFQILQGAGPSPIRRIILTASGGPFRELPLEQLPYVTPEQALQHPTWRMGPLVTINSATLMNKGQEVIEAQWLFGLPSQAIEAVIHPTSIVHAMVEFRDNTMMMQAATPDMRWSILYALTHPERIQSPVAPLDITKLGRLEFEEINLARYPCYRLARWASERGDLFPAVLNAANEVAVGGFLQQTIRFTDIAVVIEETFAAFENEGLRGVTLAKVLEADRIGRRIAVDVMGRIASAIRV